MHAWCFHVDAQLYLAIIEQNFNMHESDFARPNRSSALIAKHQDKEIASGSSGSRDDFLYFQSVCS